MICNRLLYIHLVLVTMSLAVMIGSFIGSIFGMNVPDGFEELVSAWYVIVLASFGLMGFLFFL
jgi:Mg2+ and Co2+ transporter CorA